MWLLKYVLPVVLFFSLTVSALSQCPPGVPCPIPQDTPQVNQSDPARYPEFVRVQVSSGAVRGYGSGTCFYVDEIRNKSYVFSVAHVAQRGTRGTVILHDGTQLPFVCVDSSGYRNAASIMTFADEPGLSGFLSFKSAQQIDSWQPEWSVLEVDGKIPRQRLVRGPDEPVRVGDRAFVIGWSGGRRFEIRLGTIIRLEGGIIIINVPAFPGQSGGAILRLNRDGRTQSVQDELIGLISATDGRNTIGVPISYVIQRIETAAWLPWRRNEEQITELQKQLNEYQKQLNDAIAEANKLKEEINRLRQQQKDQSPSNPPPTPSPEAENNNQQNPSQDIPQIPEELIKEWSTLKKWGITALVLIFVWLALITIWGKGFIFSNPVARIVTRLIPGRVDDIIVALLAAGEEALAKYLSEKLGISKKHYSKLQTSAKHFQNILNGNNKKK